MNDDKMTIYNADGTTTEVINPFYAMRLADLEKARAEAETETRAEPKSKYLTPANRHERRKQAAIARKEGKK